MQQLRFRNMIGAVVCAAVFPIILFVVHVTVTGIAELLGVNTNPVAGIVYLSIAMTRAYPALLLLTFTVGLPSIVWAENERALRPLTIVAVGALISVAISVATMYSVGLFSISFWLSLFEVSLLTIPLLICFCMFAVWIRVNNARLSRIGQ